MITYMDVSNADKYNVLFRQAIKALNENYPEGLFTEEAADGAVTTRLLVEDDVKSLLDYFGYMKQLNELSFKDGRASLQFIKLPLDEEVFLIDANTRTIQVPSSFQRNGISVQGDQVSEVVYFKVARFYDDQDLYNYDIAIEWIAADGTKGFSKPYGKDVDIEPGYVVFGWPLSSLITKKEGAVKFAVRFYEEDHTQINYSLSTLVQTVQVKPSIGFDLNEMMNQTTANPQYVADNLTIQMLQRRAKNSSNGSSNPGMPVIVEIVASDADKAYALDDKVRVVYFDDADANILTAVVYSENGAATSQTAWRKYDYTTGEVVDNFALNPMVYNKVRVGDIRENGKIIEKYENVIFYREVAGGADAVTEYEVVAREEVADPEKFNDEAFVFRKDFHVAIGDTLNEDGSVAKGAAIYQLLASSRSGNSEEQLYSDVIIAFKPSTPVDLAISVDDNDKKVIDSADNAVVKYVLEVTEGCLQSHLEIPAKPDEAPNAQQYKSFPEQYPFDTSQEKLTYAWYRSDDDAFSEETTEIVEGADADSLVPTKEGYYKFGVVGTLNCIDTEEQISENMCRVTYPASKPIITISGVDKNGTPISQANTPVDEELADNIALLDCSNKTNAQAGLRVTLETDEDGDVVRSDHVVYQWYEYTHDRNKPEYYIYGNDAVEAQKGIYIPQSTKDISSPADTLIDGATNEVYVPDHDGTYFCMVMNEYNGDIKWSSSPIAMFDNAYEVVANS